MEASRRGIAPKKATPGAGLLEPERRAPAADRRSAVKLIARPAPEGIRASLGDEVQLRLSLQRRAQHNLRQQFKRAAVRFSVLVAADYGSFALMRLLLRAARDYAILGPGVAQDLSFLMPRGALTGWQFPVALFLSLFVTGSYGPGDSRRNPRRLFVASALAVALPLNWNGIWRVVEYSLTTVLIWAGLTAERFTVDHVVDIVRPPETIAARTVFVGRSEKCRSAARAKVFTAGRDYRGVGFVDVEFPSAPDALGSVGELPRVIHQVNAEAVVICGYFRDGDLEDVVDAAFAAGCELVSVPRTLDLAGVRPEFVWRSGEPLVTLTRPALKGQQLAVKRVADVVGAAVGLLVLSPLLALIGIAVKLDSKGPVFFRQQRVGLGGRIFGVVKVRTMVDGADKAKDSVAHLNHTGDSRLFKIPNDPRVTRVGRFLRKWSLDEFPQLWTVLTGDMSLVGPRPFFPADLREYEDHHFDRLGAKPGITGLWQVSGRSSITDFEEVVRLDREYIARWSLWLDLKIIFRTLPAVLRRAGAY